MSGDYLTSIISSVFIYMIFAMIIGIFTQVSLALCVHNDAKSRYIESPEMWSLLCGFLGFIPGIVYLCMRAGKTRRFCYRCHGLSHSSNVICPYCGDNLAAQAAIPDEEAMRRRKKAKLFLWLYISGEILMFISVMIYIVVIMTQAMNYSFGIIGGY